MVDHPDQLREGGYSISKINNYLEFESKSFFFLTDKLTKVNILEQEAIRETSSEVLIFFRNSPATVDQRSADMWSFAIILWELATREVSSYK